MNLSVFLAIGESWEDFEKKGQDKLWLYNNLNFYSQHFNHVWVFSYGSKGGRLLPNVDLIPNRFGLHRFLYAFLLPLLHFTLLRKTSVVRGYQLTGAIPGLTAKFFFGKPLVINFGYEYVKVAVVENKKWHATFFRVLEKFILPFCDAVIVTTTSLKRHVGAIKAHSVFIIPNSVDTKLFSPKRIKKVNGAIFVGRLETQKNLGSLIEAWSGLPEKFKKLPLVFIGDGSLRRSLFLQAQVQGVPLLMQKPQSYTKLPQLLNQARLFILPSFIEGHPKALLEAMSCGLAIVATDMSGTRDVVKHEVTGLLAKPNPESLRKSIIRLLTSTKLRLRLGQSARLNIVKTYEAQLLWQKEIDLLKRYAR